MKRILERLLPAKADNTIHGYKFPVYVFALIAIISTVRSFIHLLAPDGGAAVLPGWIYRLAVQAVLFLHLHYGGAHN